MFLLYLPTCTPYSIKHPDSKPSLSFNNPQLPFYGCLAFCAYQSKMHVSLAILSFAASVWAQAVTQLIVPSATPPAGCQNSRDGAFSITITNVTTNYNGSVSSASPSRRSWDHVRRDLKGLLPRQQDGTLMLTLMGGVLRDQANRTGYIASNYQFQFDAPPQAGAIYTAGFGICANGTLSLGGSAIFWQCLSGSFNNLYDRAWAEHCVPVYFESLSGIGSASSAAPPGPESTNDSGENTIANGGGTQLSSSATFGATFGGATATASSEPNTASNTPGSASATGGSSSATATASTSESATAASSSSVAPAVMLTSVPQRVVAWAAGVIGAVAFL